MRHPLTTTLALLLCAAQKEPCKFEYEAHTVLTNLVDMADWPDEKKADLYALIVESVKADDKLTQIDRKVAYCLHLNGQRYPHG